MNTYMSVYQRSHREMLQTVGKFGLTWSCMACVPQQTLARLDAPQQRWVICEMGNSAGASVLAATFDTWLSSWHVHWAHGSYLRRRCPGPPAESWSRSDPRFHRGGPRTPWAAGTEPGTLWWPWSWTQSRPGRTERCRDWIFSPCLTKENVDLFASFIFLFFLFHI